MSRFRQFSVLTCLLFSGCSLQGPYERPPIDTPCDWRLATNHLPTVTNLCWWKQFKDPVLDGYIRFALDNNKDIRIAIHTVRAAAADLGIVRSRLYPEVNFNLDVLREKIPTVFEPLPPGFPPINYEIFPFFSLSYEVDLWQRIKSATDAALAELLASIETRRTVVLTIVSAVSASYVQLRQYDKQLEIAKDTLRSRVASLDLARVRYEGGLTSLMEVRQAESEMLEADAAKKKLELLIEIQENQLSVLLGRNPGPICRGKTLDELQRVICIPTGLPSDLLEQRPDIREAEEQLVAAHARIAEAKALYFPQINLTGIYGAESTELANLFSGAARTWSYGFSLLQTVFNAHRTTYQVNRAKEEQWEALYNYQRVIQTAFKEVDDALIAEYKTRELIDVQGKRVVALADFLRLATIRYDNGETDYLNVLTAERLLFSAQLDLADTEGKHLLSYIDLYKSLGGGWVIGADAEVINYQLWNEPQKCKSH